MDVPEAIYFIDMCHEDCWKLCKGNYECYKACTAACEKPAYENDPMMEDWCEE